MDKKFFSKIIQFRGSHYDFGYLQGEQIKNSPILARRKRQWKIYKPKFDINVSEAREVYNFYAPGLWEELKGLQDSLERPMKEILRDFGGYRVPGERSGCSIVVTKDYLVRNYDYHPSTYDSRYVLYEPSDVGYATIGPSQRIVGRMDGMNEHGLAIAYNFTHRKNPGKGFICHAIGRMVLEQTKNVEEAVHFLKEIPHRHSFTYVVVDCNRNYRVIEATPRKVSVHHIPICTNHFQKQTEENRNYTKESVERLQNLGDNWESNYSMEETFSLLQDPKKGVFVEEYKNWAGTIHTSSYNPKILASWIALGRMCPPVKFSFKEWLSGKKLSYDRIEGKVRTSLPFAYM